LNLQQLSKHSRAGSGFQKKPIANCQLLLVVSQFEEKFSARHPERRATAGEAAGAQVEGSREYFLYHADAGSSLKQSSRVLQ
jgi:hypothetical protein